MDPAARIATWTFLVGTMLSIGLKVTPSELLSALRQRSLMIRSLVVNFLIVPALGLLLVSLVPMSTDVAVGLLLMAAMPGGLNAIQFTSKAPGALNYAATLLFVLSLLGVVVSPTLATWMLPWQEPEFVIPLGRVIGLLLVAVVLPLAAGLALHRASARLAGKLAKPVALVGTVTFVVAVILLMARRKEAMASLTGAELAAMLGLILASMVVGGLLGGPSAETRRVLATATSMRNAALGLVVALNNFPGRHVAVAVIAFSALMIPPNMLLTVYAIVRARRGKRHAAQVGE
ncbi:MAG: bile acid:sodium symporter [Sedimentisphaerales bacterium]|nr:bile acid:sodium symporter [Sedimentisphaerales bacterium]